MTTETSDRKDSIIARIRALRAKTVENGATEAEAMAAAAKVAELLEKYDVEVDDLETKETSCRREDVEIRMNDRDLFRIVSAISQLTETRTWLQRQGAKRSYVFFGLDHDVEVAAYLYEVCSRALEAETEAFRKGCALLRGNVASRRVNSFTDGMSRRLAERIRELAWKRRETGKGLVVVKNEVIDREMPDMDFKTRQIRGMRQFDDSARAAGRRAADSVGLHRGVGGAGGRQRLRGS